MAIIDRKLDEDAAREEREYAARNDTAANQFWQQPPPAYDYEAERASAPSGSHRPQYVQQEGRRRDESRVGDEEAREETQSMPSSSRRHSNREWDGQGGTDESSDESAPLLSRRQRLLQHKKRQARRKIKKFIVSTLLFASVALLLLRVLFKEAGLLDPDDRVYEPPHDDGKPVDNPVWSTPVKTKPELWPTPYSPLLSSEAFFSFSAFDSFFIRARGSGSSYSGQVSVGIADEYSDDDWKRINGGVFLDRLLVKVEARFTEISLRNGIMVKKMKINKSKQGVGIYGEKSDHDTKNTFISFHVEVYLPSGRHRSTAGRAKDNSSYLPEMDVSLDNMRLSLEQIAGPPPHANHFTTMGRLKTFQLNGGLEIVSGCVANESVSITLQNGHVRDITVLSPMSTITAPKIGISVVNGPIWLNKLVAREELSLKTINGGINITDLAMAESIKVQHDSGVTGGNYRAGKLDVSSEASDIYISVDLSKDIYRGESPWGETAGTDGGSACQERSVSVHSTAGKVVVDFQNHDGSVLLNSTITSSLSQVVVNHDSSFEGIFEANSTLGSVDFHEPREQVQSDSLSLLESDSTGTQNRSKAFVVVKREGGPLNKHIVGRTWWSDHNWDDIRAFCKSKSFSHSDAGSVSLDFGLRQA